MTPVAHRETEPREDMEMMANDYDGVLDEWKLDLARRRLRRFGFSESEQRDVLQELVLKIKRFRFDPAKRNGSSESTALRCVIDRHLLSRLRTRRRHQKKVRRYGRLASRETDVNGSAVLLRLDVRNALETLPPRQRAVCEGIARGDTKTQIAADLGCSTQTVRRLLKHIRERFQVMGLDGWFDE